MYEFQALLWLFLNEVGNNGKDNACEDGTNDYQDAGSYPASPSREALHRIDLKWDHTTAAGWSRQV
jgi:hypothetical protein